MTRSDGEITQAINQLWRFRASLISSLTPAHIVGYGLLVLAFFDIIVLLIPPRFFVPAWEIQLIGQLIERVPVPLLGLSLIFLGGKDNRPDWEKVLLKLLSWATLVFAVLYFLLAPLLGVDTYRVNETSNAQINATLGEGVGRIQQLQDQLDAVQTEEQMAYILSQLSNQSIAPEQLNRPLDDIRETLKESLDQARIQTQQQAEVTRSTQRTQLLKNAIKWFLGSLASGIMLVLMWLNTKWARV